MDLEDYFMIFNHKNGNSIYRVYGTFIYLSLLSSYLYYSSKTKNQQTFLHLELLQYRHNTMLWLILCMDVDYGYLIQMDLDPIP